MERNLLVGRKYGTRDWDEEQAIFLSDAMIQDSRNPNNGVICGENLFFGFLRT